MIEENDIIITKKDISQLIVKNTEGVVLRVFDNGNAYLIEFFDEDGNTIGNGIDTVLKDDIELLTKFS